MDIIVGIALLYLVVVLVLDFFGVSSTENEVTDNMTENNEVTDSMTEAPVTRQFD